MALLNDDIFLTILAHLPQPSLIAASHANNHMRTLILTTPTLWRTVYSYWHSEPSHGCAPIETSLQRSGQSSHVSITGSFARMRISLWPELESRLAILRLKFFKTADITRFCRIVQRPLQNVHTLAIVLPLKPGDDLMTGSETWWNTITHEYFPALKSLEITGVRIPTSEDDDGTIDTAMLNLPTLTHLRMDLIDAMPSLMHILDHPQFAKLEYFGIGRTQFSNTLSGDGGLKALDKMRNLKKLALFNLGFYLDGDDEGDDPTRIMMLSNAADVEINNSHVDLVWCMHSALARFNAGSNARTSLAPSTTPGRWTVRISCRKGEPEDYLTPEHACPIEMSLIAQSSHRLKRTIRWRHRSGAIDCLRSIIRAEEVKDVVVDDVYVDMLYSVYRRNRVPIEESRIEQITIVLGSANGRTDLRSKRPRKRHTIIGLPQLRSITLQAQPYHVAYMSTLDLAALLSERIVGYKSVVDVRTVGVRLVGSKSHISSNITLPPETSINPHTPSLFTSTAADDADDDISLDILFQ